jgi:hypothetical protein
MSLLPYKRLVVYSPVSSDAIAEILKHTVEPYVGYRFDNYSKSPKPYVGKVGDRTFSIRPVFSGRNSFIPRIVGTIADTQNGSRVSLIFRLHHNVAIVSLCMTGFLIFSLIKYHETPALLFVLFIYVLTIGSFNYEYRKSKSLLLKILKADAKPGELGGKFTTETQANA